ncbi:MAG: O-antigen ligase family protein [Candidatus Paracaedibacteraceae bacterium]|nr:O-antigen ligase family protein [Candidatus Paracaedibacteraceae bacterium]
MNPASKAERYLNYSFVGLTFFDLFRPYESHSVEFQICSLLLCGFIWWHAIHEYSKKSPHKLYQVLLYGIIFCCVIIASHQLVGSPLVSLAEKTGRNRALIFSIVSMTLSIALWPAVYKQSLWKITFLCGTIITIIPLLECDTAILGVLFGFAAYLLASIQSKSFWRFIQIKIVIICLTLPFFFNTFLTDERIHSINKIIPIHSYIHRLYIWQYISKKIMERPLIGFGVNAVSQDAIGGTIITKPFYKDFKNGKGVLSSPITSKQIPSHPHNAILQWWLEMGFFGALWWAALLVFLIEKIRKSPLDERKVSFAFFSSNAMIFLFSIGFWQSWWWATWLFLLPLITHSKEKESIHSKQK